MSATAGLHRESLLEAEEQLAMLAAQLPGAVVPASLALLQVQSQTITTADAYEVKYHMP